MRSARDDSPGPADAVVVLGCGLRADGTPSGNLRRRVALGVRLFQNGAAPILLLSGGGAGPVSEAEAMRRLASRAGVQAEALILEPLSRNTAENALYSARVLRAQDKHRIVLVSDRLHLPRAALLFRLAGLTIVGRAGIPARSRAATIRLLAYEAAALPRSLLRLLFRT